MIALRLVWTPQLDPIAPSAFTAHGALITGPDQSGPDCCASVAESRSVPPLYLSVTRTFPVKCRRRLPA